MTDRLWTLDRVTLAGRPGPRLAEVSLVVRPGMTAVVGYSGAGKTSLLNLLVGYERPDEGRVTGHVSSDGRLPVFWGPQDDGLWPKVTARRHLELVSPRSCGETADELLEAFDLMGVAEATPERLSRGEASRLSVARAIASGAAVLVLDEPLAHVDPARRSRYWDRLLGYVTEAGASLVFASHEPADVLRYADRVVGLREGRVAFDGEARALYESAPDEATALLLGPVNWLSWDESACWRIGSETSPCVRPERLALEPAEDGVAAVVTSRAGGPVDESDLRCEATGEVRRFVHRPAGGRLEPGTRVRLTVVGLLAAALLGGCIPSADGPELKVSSERRFALPSSGPQLPQPRNVATGLDDEMIVLDNAGRVLVYDGAGELLRKWDMPESSVGNPEGNCVLPDGRVVVADTHYHRVVTFDPAGKVVGMFGDLGEGPGQFIYPVAVTTDPSGSLYVAEYGGNDRIQKFGPDGRFLTAFGSFGTADGQFQRPSGMVWLDGKLYVVDAFNSRVHVFTDSGDYKGLLGAADLGLHYPYDISLGPDGRLYVVEYGAGRVTVLTTQGEVFGRYGKTGRDQGEFQTPWGLAVDGRGRIWVADTGNSRIALVVPTDAVTKVATIDGGPR